MRRYLSPGCLLSLLCSYIFYSIVMSLHWLVIISTTFIVMHRHPFCGIPLSLALRKALVLVLPCVSLILTRKFGPLSHLEPRLFGVEVTFIALACGGSMNGGTRGNPRTMLTNSQDYADPQPLSSTSIRPHPQKIPEVSCCRFPGLRGSFKFGSIV